MAFRPFRQARLRAGYRDRRGENDSGRHRAARPDHLAATRPIFFGAYRGHAVMLRRPLIVLGFLLLAACKPATREFQLHGQVIQSDPSNKTIVVKHGDIPGFMPGMAMPYKVKQSSDAEGLQPGDVIDAKISVLGNGSDFWLSGVHIA